MGWWAVDKDGQELLQGDAPYDLAGEVFDKIAQEYLQDWERKPTLSELLHTIEVILKSDLERYVSDGDTTELIGLSTKTKKRSKSQPYKVGDFFTIPLKDDRYSFGRILSDILKGRMGMLVGVYDLVSDRIVSTSALRGRPFIFTPFYCSDQGWVTWRWKIIGNAPVASDDFEHPKFKQGTESIGWKIVDKDRTYNATEDDVANLEYAELWSMNAVEWRIQQYLANK